jgi:hypothetical protein
MAYYDFDEHLVTDAAQVEQNMKIRLLMVKGEFFGDYTLGNIDFEALAKKANIPAVIDAANKATIKDTPGVLSIISYSSNYDTNTRVMNVSFSVQSQYGQITVQNFPVAI